MDKTRTRSAARVVVPLAGLVWLVGTPVLTWGAVITATPFFGEQPSTAEMNSAYRQAAGAAACGLVAPVVALALAWRSGWRAVSWAAAAALLVSALLAAFAVSASR